MNVYEILVQIGEPLKALGYLRGYETDLTTHDRAQLACSEAGDSFVWAVRENGTALHKLRAGIDPVWLTYWLDFSKGNCSDIPTKCYRVNVAGGGGADGSVVAITDKVACELAALPHPLGHVERFSFS